MKARDSRFELLRIMAMMMIILAHYSSHGVMKIVTSDALKLWWGGTLFNRFFCILMLPGGRIGVALFFMITGYFSIWKDRIHVKSVVVETLIYSVLLTAIGFFVGQNSLKAVVMSPLTIINGDWWFVSSYIFLALCIPFLNQYYQSLNTKKQSLLLAGTWLLFYFLPYIFKSTYYNLVRCLFFYLAGAFMRSFVMSEDSSALRNRIKKQKWALLVSVLAIWLLDSAIKYVYYQNNIRCAKGILLDGVIHNGILIPLAAVLLFAYFMSMDKFSNQSVNLLASTTFGVYLIHDSNLRYFIWDKVFSVSAQYKSVFFPLFAIGTGIIVFLLAACLDYLRQKVMNVTVREK